MTEEAVDHHYGGTGQWCEALSGGVVLLQLENVDGYGLGFVCSDTSIYGLGLCSSTQTVLRDVAQFEGFLGLWV